MEKIQQNDYLSIDTNSIPYIYSDSMVREYSEMSEKEQSFLCNLIELYNPSKILEIGVAEGGTTSVILKCLNGLNHKSQLHSVDLRENCWNDSSKKTGFVVDKNRNSLFDENKISYSLRVGKYLPEVIDQIGGDIDLVILDTVHSLPGELLDFIAVIPYMTIGGVVVLHDIALSHNNSINDKYTVATKVLFDTVKGKKYRNTEDPYFNIAAIEIGKEDTLAHILDVFSALSLTWKYMPSDNEIEIYRNHYIKNYPASLVRLFDIAILLNKNTWRKLDFVENEWLSKMCETIIRSFDKILLYGAGRRGKAMYTFLCERGVFDGKDKTPHFLVTDKSMNAESDCAIVCLEEIRDFDKSKLLIILTVRDESVRAYLDQSDFHWYEIPEYVWNQLELLYK